MSGRIDINSADIRAFDALEELRGHGHEIVRYRTERGGFTHVGQLDEVPGLTGKIGPETLARLCLASEERE